MLFDYVCRFVTRPDVKQKRLGDFLDWSLTAISQASDLTMEGTFILDGALQSLVKALLILNKPFSSTCFTTGPIADMANNWIGRNTMHHH